MGNFKVSEREKNLMIITVGLLIVYLFYQFLLSPKWEEIYQLQTRISSAKLELKVSEARIKVMSSSQANMPQPPPTKTETQQEKALEAFKQISLATSSAGLDLNQIKPLEDSSIDKLRFALSCSGKYRNLYNFVRNLSQLKTVVLIDTLDVMGGGTPSPNLNVQMSLTAYL